MYLSLNQILSCHLLYPQQTLEKHNSSVQLMIKRSWLGPRIIIDSLTTFQQVNIPMVIIHEIISEPPLTNNEETWCDNIVTNIQISKG